MLYPVPYVLDRVQIGTVRRPFDGLDLFFSEYVLCIIRRAIVSGGGAGAEKKSYIVGTDLNIAKVWIYRCISQPPELID